MSPVARVLTHATALACALAAGAAHADGTATLNDEGLTFEYTAGPFIVPNMTPFAGDPVPVICERGTPTCDVVDLTVEFSDEFRAANPQALVDIFLSWPGDPIEAGVITLPDFDMYLYDSAGTNLSGNTAVTAANPELISYPLELLPNGTYEVRVIPFFPLGESFTLAGAVSGLEEEAEAKSGGSAGGALGAALLLPLMLLGLARRRG
jgi:hypothetical protein